MLHLAQALVASAALQSVPLTSTAPYCASFDNQNKGTLAFLYVVKRDDPVRPAIGGSLKSLEATGLPLGNGGDPIGYTRLLIEYEPCPDAQARNPAQERRGFLKQFLLGKEVSKSLNVTAKINPIGVTQTKQLALVSRNSGKKGEAWNTEVSNGQNLSQYFLVDRSTAVQLDFNFAGSSKYSGSVTGALLDIVQRGAALLAPASILITTENKDKFNDAAKFVDDSVNGLMGTDVKERSTIERIIGPDDGGAVLADVVLFAADANSTVRPPYSPLGAWRVRLDSIVPALLGKLSAGHGDRLDSNSLSASAVLNFRIDDSQTLNQVLAGRTAVSGAKDAYLKAAADKKPSAAATLCSAVAVEAANLGLSPADVGGVVWAYAHVMEPGAAPNGALLGACSKIDHYPVS